MPELPDIVVYIEKPAAARARPAAAAYPPAELVCLVPVTPPITEAEGKRVTGLRRLGKRIVLCLEDDLYIVLHLMVAGRLRWLASGAKLPGKLALAAFDFPNGTLVFTEAGTKKRASLHLVRGEATLDQFRMGGLEVLEVSLADFTARLTSENHTLKRALTDPHLFSGIGNAYSDEILHRAQLSPITLTDKLSEAEIARLYEAVRAY